MRLTKEEFCKIIDTFEKMSREESKILEVLKTDCEWTPSTWISSYANLIDLVCDFTDADITMEYGTSVDYYCYNLDFGKKWKPGMIIINDKDVPCRNSQELWDLLILEGKVYESKEVDIGV